MRWPVLLLIVSLFLSGCASHSPAASAFFYLGTYSGSNGIYGVSLDLATGTLSTPKKLIDAAGPSWISWDGARGRLFAAADGKDGAAAGFKIDSKTRGLTAMNQVAAGGSGTTYVAISPDGRALLAANYNAGTVSLMPVSTGGTLKPPVVVNRHTGGSVDPSRQKSAHPHAIQLDPSGKFALACDLGNDKIYIYALDSVAAKLTLRNTYAMPPGSGPRHLMFSLGGHFVYVINELTSTISVLKWDVAAAKLSMLQTLPLLPNGFTGAHRACEIAIHPSGQWLYAVDRGPDLITTFKINPTSAKLTPIATTPAGGVEARHFAIAPGGGFLVLANMNSNKLVSFRIDLKTGALTPASEVSVTKPSCILFVP